MKHAYKILVGTSYRMKTLKSYQNTMKNLPK